jgi:hypothetical protein
MAFQRYCKAKKKYKKEEEKLHWVNLNLASLILQSSWDGIHQLS